MSDLAQLQADASTFPLLAVPVVSRTGEVIGGLFFGHKEPAIFAERDERAISEPRPSDRGQSRIRVPENVRGLRVLVVDDDRDATELLAELLGGYGVTPIVASSAEEAFLLLERERPDALVSDIGMPLEDGYSLIRRIRKLADPVLSAIPAMALTAFARKEEKAKALWSGFDHHLPKPVDPNELFAVLGSMIATRRRPT